MTEKKMPGPGGNQGTGTNQINHPHNTEYPPVLQAALSLLEAGFSVFPVNSNKRPRGPWKEWQTRQMTQAEARQQFNNGACLAVVCGEVSGNLETLDFDDPSTFDPFLALLADLAPGLPEKLTVRRQTPSGGFHIVYRSSGPVQGNLKLASLAEKNQAGEDCRIETRGTGGYILAAPSPGYKVLSGSLKDCPTLAPAEIETLHRAARLFDQQPARPATGGSRATTGDAPGDLFNRDHSGGDILTANGWKPDDHTTAGQGYTRPGKKGGVSAVLLENGNVYCWSSNAAPLEPGKSYTPFALLAAFNHRGDFSAAARELVKQTGGNAAPLAAVRKNRRLNFAPASELTGMQSPTWWIVRGFIEAGNLLCFFAPPESLKTFVLLDIGLCIATGKDWHGYKVTAGPVLYVCGEGRRGIGRRLQAWERHHGIKADLFFVSSVSAALLDPASLAELEAAAEEIAERYGKPALIIIDTLNRNFGPGDENSTTDMTRFIAALDKLRERLECAVAVVHHTGLGDTGRGRGNSSLRGALDFEYTINRSQGTTIEGRTIELSCSKAKDHERPATIAFQPVVVDLGFVDEESQPVTSLALDRTDRKKTSKKQVTEAQRQAIASYWTAAMACPTIDRNGNFEGVHLEAWRVAYYEASTADNQGAKKKAFQRHRDNLAALGLLTAKNDLYRLTTTEAGQREREIENGFSGGTAGHFAPAGHLADKEELEPGRDIDLLTGEILKTPANTGLDEEAGQRDMAGHLRDMSQGLSGTQRDTTLKGWPACPARGFSQNAGKENTLPEDWPVIRENEDAIYI